MSKSNRKHNSGFTLVETIVCILIVTLVTSLLFVMTDTAKKSYVKLEKSSEGQILCATLTSVIQRELRFAKNIERCSGQNVELCKKLADNTYMNPNMDESALNYRPNYGFYAEGYNYSSPDTTDPYEFKYTSSTTESLVGANCTIKAIDGKLYKVDASNSNTKEALTSEAAYVYDLKADVALLYNSTEKKFYVMLQILDTDGTVLIERPFVVDNIGG